MPALLRDRTALASRRGRGGAVLTYWRHTPACPGSRVEGGGHWRLLTPPGSQHKLELSERNVGVYTEGLMLAPADRSGHEMCPWRTAGCTAVCLNTAGMGTIPSVQAARVKRTISLKSDPAAFFAELAHDLEGVRRRAASRGMRPAVRLNVVSDQPWEAWPVCLNGTTYRNLMQAFPDLQFYDYTKSPTRAKRALGLAPGSQHWPPNYHLTFSRSEDPRSEAVAEELLRAGGNVSVVFRDQIPATWHGFPVVDATRHDARFLDPPGSVAGLRALGPARHDTSGFVVEPGPGNARRRPW